MAREDQFWLPKLVRLDQFWQQKWSGETNLAKFSAKFGPARPSLGGTNFGMTGQALLLPKETMNIFQKCHAVFNIAQMNTLHLSLRRLIQTLFQVKLISAYKEVGLYKFIVSEARALLLLSVLQKIRKLSKTELSLGTLVPNSRD